jgi:polyhydroxybutyrate depolymerase
MKGTRLPIADKLTMLPRLTWNPQMPTPRLVALLAFLAVSALALPECAEAASGRISVESNNIRRTATVVEYSRLKKGRRATVIVLHGGQGTGGRIRRTLGLDVFALSSGRVMVYPDGIDGHWNRLRPAQTGPDDPAFILALVNKLVADGISDRHRIFVMGFSSGGILALRLACEHAEAFAGVGAIAAELPAEIVTTCKPSRPIPMVLVNGTADPLVPFLGGKASLTDDKGELASTEATLAAFAAANSCATTPRTVSPLPDRDPNDGSRVAVERFTGCKAPVELVRVNGGGHTIPGRRTISNRGVAVGAQNNDFDSGRLIFDFFRHMPR